MSVSKGFLNFLPMAFADGIVLPIPLADELLDRPHRILISTLEMEHHRFDGFPLHVRRQEPLQVKLRVFTVLATPKKRGINRVVLLERRHQSADVLTKEFRIVHGLDDIVVDFHGILPF